MKVELYHKHYIRNTYYVVCNAVAYDTTSQGLSLLLILRFVLDEKFQWNASKFAIFYIVYENPKLRHTYTNQGIY